MSTVEPIRLEVSSTLSAPRATARRRRGFALVSLAAAGALLLGGCGDGVSPGTAAMVGEDRITVDEVDDLARVICATQGEDETGEKSPTASVRGLALNVLLGISVADQLAGLDNADPRQVREGTQGVEQARQTIPEEYLPLFDEIVRDSARAQIVVTDEAARRVQESGGDPADQQAVAQAAAELQAQFVAENDVEVSSRFGSLDPNGQLTAGDGSLSVPVSETAKAFSSEAGGDYPASQRCS